MKVHQHNVLSDDTTTVLHTWKEDFEKLYNQEYSKEFLNEDFANSISHMKESIESDTINFSSDDNDILNSPQSMK